MRVKLWFPGMAFSIVHYSDVIKSTMVSQIADILIAYWTDCSGADQRKHQISASLAFLMGIHTGDGWILRLKSSTAEMGGLKKAIQQSSLDIMCKGIFNWYHNKKYDGNSHWWRVNSSPKVQYRGNGGGGGGGLKKSTAEMGGLKYRGNGGAKKAIQQWGG